MTDDILAPCLEALAKAANTLDQIDAIKRELGKLNGQASSLDRQVVFDAIVGTAPGYELGQVVGTGTIHYAIASALLDGSTDTPDARISIPLNQFTKHLEPIDFLVDDILLTGCVYSLTARPGSGKTTVTILLALCVAKGLQFAGREVDQGSVLYFAGENPDDIKRRFLAACQRNGLNEDEIDNVFVVPGSYKFSEIGERIGEEMQAGVKLVIVDTSAVYFEGDNENDPIQMTEHALRMRDVLAGLPGKPTVIINCHPAKGSLDDNLVPRGGGGFEAAIDGNLYCKKLDTGVTVHHTAKFRGVEFEPLNFQIASVTHERVKTVRGKLIYIPVAEHVSDERMEEIEHDARFEELELLKSVSDDAELSDRLRASKLGWLQKSGEPYHLKVQRRMKSLKKQGLINSVGGRTEVSSNGQKYLDRTGTH